MILVEFIQNLVFEVYFVSTIEKIKYYDKECSKNKNNAVRLYYFKLNERQRAYLKSNNSCTLGMYF